MCPPRTAHIQTLPLQILCPSWGIFPGSLSPGSAFHHFPRMSTPSAGGSRLSFTLHLCSFIQQRLRPRWYARLLLGTWDTSVSKTDDEPCGADLLKYWNTPLRLENIYHHPALPSPTSPRPTNQSLRPDSASVARPVGIK